MGAQGRLRIGVLASGEDTTLQAILDATGRGELDAEVAIVISNYRDSGALEKARLASVKDVHLSSKTHPDPTDLDLAISSALRDARVERRATPIFPRFS